MGQYLPTYLHNRKGVDNITLFKKKPVVVDAVQFTGDNHDEIMTFVGYASIVQLHDTLIIATLDGDMTASKTDWIIKGVADEFYTRTSEIFKQTYERVHPVRCCMVCPSTDGVKRYKTNIDGRFVLNGGDGYVQYCAKHAEENRYTDEHLHSTHRDN